MSQLIGSTLIVRKGFAQQQRFQLTQNEILIGRDTSADITIDEQIVSRKHARIFLQNNRILVQDLNSSNGTYVNGQQIFTPTAIQPGDEISIGPEISLILQPGEQHFGQPKPANLIVTIGRNASRTYPLQKSSISIGRSNDNDIIIPSQLMSRHHATIEQVGNSIFFTPSPRATNPFYLQGNPVVQRIQISHLAEFQIFSDDPNLTVTLQLELPMDAGATAFAARSAPISQPPPPVQSPGGTMIDADFDMAQPAFSVAPSELIVQVAGFPAQIHRLEKNTVTIGRAPDNDIVIASEIVSRHQGRFEYRDRRYEFIPNPNVTNPMLYEGRMIERHRLHHQDTLRIHSTLPGQMVTMLYNAPSEESATVDFSTVSFGEKNVLTFGRNTDNDVVLAVPNVSQYHAQIEKVGQRYRVIDLDSSNGTFVNDEPVTGESWASSGDAIRIGPYRFIAGNNQFSQFDETGGLQVKALGLNKWVRKDLNILKNISVAFQPREFIVVVGQSGGGKSTLLDSIAGYRPATHGRVTVNGINVYKNFDAIRNEIGYVPQKDIIHMELTVYQALDYAAQLRMPRDTTKTERHKRIMEVLDDLDLAHRKDVQISGLSGGQQKRVSIGVELLTKPGLFFLDEPTSGLDPGTETSFMHLMRRLADQGRTIVLVTHATKNVMLADKVVFLARGGYLAWFGPPDEALQYFDQFRSDRERRTRPMEFDQIYAILDDPSRGSAEEWAKRFAMNPAFQEHIVKPLSGQVPQQAPPPPPGTSGGRAKQNKPKRARNVSAVRQFLILSARNIKILTRDRSSLTLMLIAAPLVAMLDLIIAPLMGSDPYNTQTGTPKNAAITLFLMTIYCLLVAGLSQMREFVKESDIYKRERLVNLKIIPYVMSKVWVALLLAFYHAIAYAVVHHIAFQMPGGTTEFLLTYITLVFAAMAGMMTGLLASALAPAASSAPMLMILLIIPQIVLSGALAPVPSYASAPASTRWAFQAFIGITGMGSDVAADPCWQLDEEVRDAMTLQDKAERGCRCMGVAVFDTNSCNFPGIGEYYLPEIDEPEPIRPPDLREKPPEPVIPEKPAPPEDSNNQVAMSQYMNSLQMYQEDVTRIQELYKSEMELYEVEADVYQAEMEVYQEEYTQWEVARTGAVGGAEGLIESISEEFGWAFVNKEDPNIFYPWIITTWVSQMVIIGIFIVLSFVLIKRKDVN